MPFPLTHILVAGLVGKALEVKDLGAFTLGSISPDAVHHRKGLIGAAKSEIGPAKKITHLQAPKNGDWGAPKSLDVWTQDVLEFASQHKSDFAKGYATHILTDIFNNTAAWVPFKTAYPEEYAKGYKSLYYTELAQIDLQLYHQLYKDSALQAAFNGAKPQGIAGYISEEEVRAIHHNIKNEAYNNAPNGNTENCRFITYSQAVDVMHGAAEFCLLNLKQVH